jgi:hypothetical protein
MKPVLMAGTLIVNFALIFYTVAFIKLKKGKLLTTSVIKFQILGVVFDILATVLMIMGSTNSPFSLHGILGYSSLTGMIIDSYLLYKAKSPDNSPVELSPKLKLYSTIAYLWWIAAYITGALIVVLRRIGG